MLPLHGCRVEHLRHDTLYTRAHVRVRIDHSGPGNVVVVVVVAAALLNMAMNGGGGGESQYFHCSRSVRN